MAKMKKSLWPGLIIAVVLLVALAASPVNGGGRPHDPPERGHAVRHDTSPPLRDLDPPPPQRGKPDREVPLRAPPDLAGRHKPSGVGRDPVRQVADRPTQGASATPGTLTNFEGLSDDDNAAVLGFRYVPPDTEGDVGLNHYVQFINGIFAVWDKNDPGAGPIFGPVPGNFPWQGLGGICETNNDGDPIVLYDHLADRWVFSQFAIEDPESGHQCVAVSATEDPTGSYHQYDFHVSPNAFNDYPKLGVWPDGYYLTANELEPFFQGVIAVVFEREQMLTGAPAQFVKFGPLQCGEVDDIDECFFSPQPSHLEGPPPAIATPSTFIMAFDDETWGTGDNPDGYRLWDFSVDWVNPANSRFTPLIQADTVELDANMCNFSSTCIPQPRPGEGLYSLSQMTMYRAQYRSFSTYETIVVNHTVDANGNDRGGIRWAELRRNDGTPRPGGHII